MSKNIEILDTTLRDGGYCNGWQFGEKNIEKIVKGLTHARIDIIECGILTEELYDSNYTKYSDITEININDKLNGSNMLVALINYGEYDVDKLPKCEDCNIDGIRIAFHKKDYKSAMLQTEKLKRKGYKVFVQPMLTVTYSEIEYRALIKDVNEAEPYAFYIVDSFGSMDSKYLDYYFELADTMLKDTVILGLHLHNNLQLAFSNARAFAEKETKHRRIVDSSVMGMGRGAGNLNTELFLSYMNSFHNSFYRIEPILELIDDIINIFYCEKHWGYSLPNYLSALYVIHPNYASYLSDKNTLTISMIQELLSLIDIEKKNEFDKGYIEKLYFSYMNAKTQIKNLPTSLKYIFDGKEVLIIAPGKSIDDEYDKISKFVDENYVITVCVNFNYSKLPGDYVFISNQKRYENYIKTKNDKIIVTSNVITDTECNIVEYFGLLCDEKYIRDNATIMLINLLISSNVRKIYLAGVDGYDCSGKDNYSIETDKLVTSMDYLEQLNLGMNRMLYKFKDVVDIEFVTKEYKIKV